MLILKHIPNNNRPKRAPNVLEELSIGVRDDWDAVVADATRIAAIIDRHLDFESKMQGRVLRPVALCPNQRVNLISDLSAV